MATPGRNEPCSCGSGKKYKHCCLGKNEAAARATHAAEAKAEAKTEQPPAEAAPTTAQETSRSQTNRPTRHATQQPWKRKDEKRGAPKFSVPRRSGGS